MKTVLRVFPWLRRYPGMAFLQLACAVLGTLMVLVPPSAIKTIVDDVIRGAQPEKLTLWVLLAAARGKNYYLLPFHLVLFAAGAVGARTFDCTTCDPFGELLRIGHGKKRRPSRAIRRSRGLGR